MKLNLMCRVVTVLRILKYGLKYTRVEISEPKHSTNSGYRHTYLCFISHYQASFLT
jgi:hypothetical protein